MSITSSSSNITEDTDTSSSYNDPQESSRVISNLLKPFFQTKNSPKEESKLLTELFEKKNISHGVLNSVISQNALQKAKLMLKEHFFNNFTCGNTLRRDPDLDEGQTSLNYDNFKTWSPEFVDIVIDSILKIKYVKKKNLKYNATLSKPSAHGTKHSDLMDFLVRLVFTFMLSEETGEIELVKHFLISHPDYNNGMEESMAIGCHEFVVLDSKSSGSAEEWKKMMHQAKAPDCEVLTFVVSVYGDDLPEGITLEKFMEDWKKAGGNFETYDEDYYNTSK